MVDGCYLLKKRFFTYRVDIVFTFEDLLYTLLVLFFLNPVTIKFNTANTLCFFLSDWSRGCTPLKYLNTLFMFHCDVYPLGRLRV